MKFNYIGSTAGETALLVAFSVDAGTTKRFGNVYVPYADLLDRNVLAKLDRETRRRIISDWSDRPLPLDWS